MANAAAPLVEADGTITAYDGAGTPLTEVLQYEDGDLSISDLNQGNMETQVFMDRGEFYAIRKTARRAVKVSFTCHAVNLVGAFLDAVRMTGAWASATSTLPTSKGGSEVHCIKLVWSGERTNFGASADASVTMNIVRITSVSFKEGRPGTLSFEGEAYAFATSDIVIT